ncbi:hypothetical protein HGRIS_009325 [Hohenbuehelia grisea]|uniref:Uncharacterized protein n=1 Tax=Hohenbuehelia grisea TaxID=104357 RepID=A0ABR3J187_9AGAR
MHCRLALTTVVLFQARFLCAIPLETLVLPDETYDNHACKIVQALHESCLSSRAAEGVQSPLDRSRRTPASIPLHTASLLSNINPCTCARPFFSDVRPCFLKNRPPERFAWMEACLAKYESIPQVLPNNPPLAVNLPRALVRRAYSTLDPIPKPRALQSRSDSSEWNTTTILTPIIVGLGVTIFFAGLFLYFYRKTLPPERRTISWMNGTFKPRGGLFGFLRVTSRVREADRSNTWEIDQENAEARPRPARHHRLASSPVRYAQYDDPSPSWLSSSLRAAKDAIPAPWKKKPVTVQSVSAKRGFRIDESDRATSVGTTSLPPPPRHSIADTIDDEHPPGDRPWKYLPEPLGSSEGSGRVGTEELYMGRDPDSDAESDDGNAPDPAEEHTSLMSAPSPMGARHDSVLLISRTGNDFSVESGASQEAGAVNIIPPTPVRSPGPSRHLKFPPVPNYPAPRPTSPQPTSPPRQPNPSLDTGSHNDTRVHSSPASNLQTLPPPSSETPMFSLTATPPIVAPHKRRPSNDSLRRAEHVRRPSVDLLPRSPPTNGRPLEQDDWPTNSGAQSRPLHKTALLNGSSSTPYLPDLPLTPQRRPPTPPASSAGHSRNQSAQGALNGVHENSYPYPSQAHLATPKPGSHQRTLSAEHLARPPMTDGVMLFPGSVRGAGYYPGTPSMTVSTDSLYSQNSGIPRPEIL